MIEIEKDWMVDCWGTFADDWGTDIFYTEQEAKQYFNQIKKGLSRSRYTITKNSIMDNEDNTNTVVLSNLKDYL